AEAWASDLVLDPIPSIQPDALVKAMTAKEHEKARADLVKLMGDKGKFVAALRGAALALLDKKPRLSDAQLAELSAYLKSPTAVQYVRVDKAKLVSLAQTAQGSDPA